MFVPSYTKIPRLYGIAYRCYDRDGAICYPIPLNWIVRWTVHFCWIIRMANPSRMELMKFKAYQRGRLDGINRAQGILDKAETLLSKGISCFSMIQKSLELKNKEER